MVCIYCGAKTEIVNSRHQNRSNSTWRRRRCLNCGALITSLEQADYPRLWVVLDSKGRIHPFKRDQLFLSIYESLRHRKSAVSDAEGITTTIIGKLTKKPSEGRINKQDIVNTAMSVLKRFDKAALVHYEAYYGSKT